MPDDEREGRNGAPDSVWSAVGQHAGWGLTMAASMGFFLFLGYRVDRWLGTMPVLTILGALLGAGAGFYSMFRHLTATGGDGSDEPPPGDGPRR